MVSSELILAVDVVSFVLGLPANLLALYAFSAKIHSKPNPTDILLLNLTVSDLLFLFFLPLKMHEAASDLRWTFPSFLCSLTSFVFFSTIYTSSLLLAAVSVVRYVGVAFPIAYRQLQKPAYAVAIGALVWLISAAHCSITFVIIEGVSPGGNVSSEVCYQNFTEAQLEILLPVRLEMFFVLCLVPLVICIFCYSRCISILHARPRISPAKKQRAIGMAMGTLAMFLLCVVPYNLSHLVGFFEGSSPVWRNYTLLLCTLNTCIDPIIFYFSSSVFRCSSEKFICKKRLVTSSERPGSD